MRTVSIVKLNPGPVGENKTAVIFVHGFTGDRVTTWGSIPEFLMNNPRLRGWDFFGFGYSSRKRFDVLGLWSADPKIEEITTKLQTELVDKKYEAFALVAHSLGGLVVERALVRFSGLRQRTTHVVLFGTPTDGLEKARFIRWLKQQISDSETGGPFITSLRASWKELKLDTDPPFRFLSVAGEIDQFVPPDSSLKPFPDKVQRVIPGNHLTMLDAASADAPCVKLIAEALTGGAALAGLRSSARTAEQKAKFQESINRLWPGRADLDDGGATELALALDGSGRRDDAIEFLRGRKSMTTDSLGVLAGRLKRRWQMTRGAADFQSARQLYAQAWEQTLAQEPVDDGQAYYHGINLAYLALAGSTREEETARNLANAILVHTTERGLAKDEHWRLATRGDALLILGRFAEAKDCYVQAVKQRAVEPWAALSMEEQSLRVADLAGLTEAQAREITDIFEGDGE